MRKPLMGKLSLIKEDLKGDFVKRRQRRTMRIFDSHCHLEDRAYDGDRDQVLARMASAGVEKAMIVGITESSSRKAVSLAATHPGLFASVGVHPHDAKDCSENTLNRLKPLAPDPNVRAWGETGLDFNRMYSPKAEQEKWFVRQLEIADELRLPLIFHERDSQGRFLEILKSHYPGGGRAGVVHCFSGTGGELEAYLEMGFYIGITGILTIQQRGRYLRELAPRIPENRLLVETDAPYLTPAPEKNKTRRNEPTFVRSVLLKLAQVRDTDPEALAKQVWQNTHALFGIRE